MESRTRRDSGSGGGKQQLSMDFLALAQQCAPLVAPQTMAAIVRTESGFRPLAIGVNGGGRLVRQPETVEEAVVTAKWLIQSGYNIDMGLGQVNSSNLRRTGLTVEDAFDPCKNLAASAMILHGNYKDASRKIVGEQAALNAAISAYNTGNFTAGFSNGYVQRVVNNAGATSGVVANTVAPIPLMGGAKPQAKAHTNSKMQAAKAPKPGREAAPVDGWNVYQSSNKSEMVF
jgi:type IV secretion system protein VirB1